MIPDIPRFIDLMADVQWTLDDIDNRARAWVESVVPNIREQELQTIFIGAIMGLRAPTPKELGERALIQEVKEATGLRILEARVDMALINAAMAVEAAQRRLQLDPRAGDEADQAERAAAQQLVDTASAEVVDLVARRAAARHPAPAVQEPQP